jgi:hypothetical protein
MKTRCLQPSEDVNAGAQAGLVQVIHQNTGWFTDVPHELTPAMVLVNGRFEQAVLTVGPHAAAARDGPSRNM